MTTTNRYRINRQPRLIDLNGELANFSISFECASFPPQVTYKMYIATQTELDMKELDALPFKVVNGRASGNIIADEDKYDNYFLVLCSDTEIDVDVQLDIRPIEPKSNATISQPTPPSTQQVSSSSTMLDLQGGWTPSKIFFWVAFVLIIALLVYYLFFKNAGSSSSSSSVTTVRPRDNSNNHSSRGSASVIDDINDL